ncbi:transcriptional regulator, partial [Rothia sp. HMSC065B04]
ESQSASASASASSSASANASTSTATSASASANPNSSSSSAKESGSQKGGLSGASAIPTDATDSSYGPKVYEHYKEIVEEAKKDYSTKRTTNTEGNVYADPDGSIAVVETQNGSYISIENDGSWVRVTPEGEVIAVTEKGGWAAVKPNGEIINVDENGAASIMNVKTSEISDDYQSVEVPKTPAPVGDFPAPKKPVKPTSLAAN